MSKLLLAVLFCFSSVSFADTFFVEEPSNASGGYENSLAQTILGLVKNEVVNQGHRLSQTKDAAKWVLSPQVYELGSSYIMTLSKSKNGKVVFSEKLKSDSPEGLDVVSERLVRSALSNQKVEETAKIDVNNRSAVSRDCYFGFGPGYLSGLNSDDSGFAWAVGYIWGLDPKFSLRLNLEGVNINDSDADAVALALGGQYYFNNLRHAPYVLGLIGHSWSDSEEAGACAKCTGDSDQGWAFTTGLGMHFFRNTAVSVALEATYTYGFYDVAGEKPGMTNLKFVVLW